MTRDARPAWLEELGVEIEQSDAVYDYCVITWPGYMQTPDYARVLVEQAVPWLAPEEAERRIAERVSQTQRMTEANRPMLWVVADESILWRRFGGASVTRDQLDHVMRLVEAGRVHLQFMQADAEHHPGNSGPFKLLSSTRRPDVLYTESTREGQLVTDTDDVVHYRMLFAQLQGAAMPVADTLDRLRNTVERLK
ncbi:hypothetical protein CLV72_109367 [Allonocardiopsis opalescens]|uniref:DUF5753 domain-containing protein n=1 Tax=Allonocardiopsis opalescens TaxID=1144618 RepID=A0A2T0PW35_9ACTN|nr:hypothetical protein CLV72_109367 [Allonocardiopsis opalescens]